MKKLLLSIVLVCMSVASAVAQRMTDALDRGLVAIQTDGGVFCSWRILAEEYYDVTYNLYRDGVKVNQEPLTVSNYTDAAGTATSKYTVKAVVGGQETGDRREGEKETGVWAQHWLEITPDHGDLKSTYVPNDACCADVDGDGELEILIKFDNQSWASTSYQKAGYEGEYFIIEVYKLNGKRLWWIDLGPNMADFQNNEQNIIAYDWDQDGRAEAVIRASDGTVIHMADGEAYEIGDKTKNYLGSTNSSQWFVHEGAEFLVYMNGATGKPYQVMDYPLKRLEAGETDLNAAWGDGYGHRSTKHFFGAPCLDGRKASIFLARGIYTRHKMVALDVNPETHELTERWRWSCNTPGSSWYGQGYHNYSVADVDWDGRDEIVFGSMVIDDNGHGLSTTGLGHGDAHHVGDFNPYVHGQEIFACNEDKPGNNFRDATTSKIYYRYTAGDDDGRAMMGNFSDDYPGCQGVSSRDPGLISSVINGPLDGGTKNNITQNFRIYWDGDLLEETQDYSSQGKNTAVTIYKYGKGVIETLKGSMTNNDTKGTPCYQGDVLGDWREEVITRTKDNKIRIYTTTIPTDRRIPTLWHDHQYRQAMAWQMCGYNQPPHVSYFLGELEGITQAPPPLTMTGRMEIKNGGTISSEHNGAQVLLAETADMEVTVTEPCQPAVIIDNAPSWVQGHDDNDNIEYGYYTHTLRMEKTALGDLSGSNIRLVKQGDGILRLEGDGIQSNGGPTDVWAGTVVFSKGLRYSRLWLNRFAKMETTPDSGTLFHDIEAEYGSVIRPGGNHGYGSMGVDTLKLGFGSVLELDLFSKKEDFDHNVCDGIGAWKLVIETKDWENGPKYKAPVFRFVTNLEDGQTSMPEGKYEILQANEFVGNLEDVVIEGLDGMKCYLTKETNENGFSRIYLVLQATRSPLDVRWNGDDSYIWDFNNTENFLLPDGTKGAFVTGDKVTFDDGAYANVVDIREDVAPSSVVFANEDHDFTLYGNGSIIGGTTLFKTGAANLTIRNVNKFTGGVVIDGGTVTVSALAHSDGAEYGALGGVNNPVTLQHGGGLSLMVNQSDVTTSQNLILGEGGGVIALPVRTLTVKGKISQTGKSYLEKTGDGTLVLGGSCMFSKLVLHQGIVQAGELGNIHQYPDTVVLDGGTLKDPDNISSYSSNTTTMVVPEGSGGNWYLDSRCDYKGKLIGKGNLVVHVTSVRCNMQGDWSQFEGELNFLKTKIGQYDPLLQWNNSYGLGKATVRGDFPNNGRDVSIGRLIGGVNISGKGLTTVKVLDLKVIKGRAGIQVSPVNVEGSMMVTGEINIQASGLKAGDEVVFWKVGALQTTSNTVVNLPELPEGLYWDTTDFLKKEGKLRVTDTPTGISDAVRLNDKGQMTNDNWYSLDGRKLNGEPKVKGIYIYKGKKVKK